MRFHLKSIGHLSWIAKLQLPHNSPAKKFSYSLPRELILGRNLSRSKGSIDKMLLKLSRTREVNK